MTKKAAGEANIISNDVAAGGRSPIIVSEPGLCILIMSSRKPEAKAFKRWAAHEVMPAIRKTGSYSSRPVLPDFSNPAAAARAWADGHEAKLVALEAAKKAEEERDTALEMLGFAENWKQVKGISWLNDYFNLTSAACQQAGRILSMMSRARGIEIREAPDPTYGPVHIYHESIIAELLSLVRSNPNILSKYRK